MKSLWDRFWMWSNYLTLHVFGLEADPMNKIRSSGVFQFEALLSEVFFLSCGFSFTAFFLHHNNIWRVQLWQVHLGLSWTWLNLAQWKWIVWDCPNLTRIRSHQISIGESHFPVKWVKKKSSLQFFFFTLTCIGKLEVGLRLGDIEVLLSTITCTIKSGCWIFRIFDHFDQTSKGTATQRRPNCIRRTHSPLSKRETPSTSSPICWLLLPLYLFIFLLVKILCHKSKRTDIKTWLSKHQTSRLLHVLGHPYSSSPRYSGLEERFQKLILLASVHCDEDEVTTTMKEHLMERLPLSGVVNVARYIGLSGSGWYPTRSNMISKDPSSWIWWSWTMV